MPLDGLPSRPKGQRAHSGRQAEKHDLGDSGNEMMQGTPWWYRYVRNWRVRMWLETGQTNAPLSMYTEVPLGRAHSHLSAADAASASRATRARQPH
jgi:hypothetical protein